MADEKTPIFLFDGECGICDATVAFFLAHSLGDSLHFAALQSDFAGSLLQQHGINEPDLKSALLVADGIVYSKSSAIARGLLCCLRPYSFLAVFRFIPRCLRDWGYDLVARNRHRISLQQKQQCRLLGSDERARFLDLA